MTRMQTTYAIRPTGLALMSSRAGSAHAGSAHAPNAGNAHAQHASLDNAQVRTATMADVPGCAHGDTPLAHAESGLRARRLRALGACPHERTSNAPTAPIPTTRTSYSSLRHTSACHLAYGFDRVLSSRGSPLLLDCIGFGSKRGRKGGRCHIRPPLDANAASPRPQRA